MPDLRKLFFFSRDKDYVDITRLPTQKKKIASSKRQNAFPKAIPKPIKIKIKRIKLPKPKPLPPKKILKAPKAVQKRPKLPKPVIKPPSEMKTISKSPKEILAGDVTHFFDKIQVCVIKLKRPLKINDTLHFLGKESDFVQQIDSMQINHQQVMVAKKGDEIGLKVIHEVRSGDKVFLP